MRTAFGSSKILAKWWRCFDTPFLHQYQFNGSMLWHMGYTLRCSTQRGTAPSSAYPPRTWDWSAIIKAGKLWRAGLSLRTAPASLWRLRRPHHRSATINTQLRVANRTRRTSSRAFHSPSRYFERAARGDLTGVSHIYNAFCTDISVF